MFFLGVFTFLLYLLILFQFDVVFLVCLLTVYLFLCIIYLKFASCLFHDILWRVLVMVNDSLGIILKPRSERKSPLRPRVSDDVRRKILQMYNDDFLLVDIAGECGVSVSFVSRLIKKQYELQESNQSGSDNVLNSIFVDSGK